MSWLPKLFIMPFARRIVPMVMQKTSQNQNVTIPLRIKNTSETINKKQQFGAKTTDLILFCGTGNKGHAPLL